MLSNSVANAKIIHSTFCCFFYRIMLKWVAQLLESQGDMQGALHYYTRAQDACAIVRVLCFLGEFPRAAEIVTSSGDRAAAYHLARQCEALGRLDEALVFFSKAHAFGNAIRICKVSLLLLLRVRETFCPRRRPHSGPIEL